MTKRELSKLLRKGWKLSSTVRHGERYSLVFYTVFNPADESEWDIISTRRVYGDTWMNCGVDGLDKIRKGARA